jgi:putative spermidine/putrescine transport system ATP-binding protein
MDARVMSSQIGAQHSDGNATSGGGEIRLENVSKRFGDTLAIKSLSLTVPDGQYCCLLGPSGCGKTTLLRMLAGHETPTNGRITIGAREVTLLPPQRRGTAMMFQSYGLFPHLSVVENVAFSDKMKGVPKAARLEKAHAIIKLVRLGEFANRRPAQLSGGQQQRVALARALITQPKVLLLDEPLSSLDEQLRLEMRSELRAMHKRFGITFIHVTHTQLEALGVSEMVVVMNHGRIEQVGTPEQVYSFPNNEYVARFMGGQIVVSGTVREIAANTVTIAATGGMNFVVTKRSDSSAMKLGEAAAFAVRRDKVAIMDHAGVDNATPRIRVRVEMVEYQGTFAKIQGRAECVPDFVAYVTDGDFIGRGIRPGNELWFGWQPIDMRLLNQQFE